MILPDGDSVYDAGRFASRLAWEVEHSPPNDARLLSPLFPPQAKLIPHFDIVVALRAVRAAFSAAASQSVFAIRPPGPCDKAARAVVRSLDGAL
jgi:hypothetical protein